MIKETHKNVDVV